MEQFDVAVVGGGPAGSTCAWSLRRAGCSVVVLDRAVFPRDKVCAGWITPAVVDLLNLDVQAYSKGRVFQPILGFRTGLIDDRGTLETRYSQPVSFGIRRYEFDHYLLQRSGAQLRCGQSVSTVRRAGDRWILNEIISAPMLVGAGGHFCPIARWLNRARPAGPIVATLEMEVSLGEDQLACCSVQADTPALFFCPDLKGYGWCFRKGNFLNVGLGRQDPRHLPARTDALLAFLKSQQLVPADLPAPSRGHAYLLRNSSPRQSVDDGVILVGDAAGLADPRSGEGIRPAIESGLLAAAAIIGAQGIYHRERLEGYRQRLPGSVAAEGFAARAAAAVPAEIVRRVGRACMRSRWFTRQVLLDRWFLGADRHSWRGNELA